jgi:F0F1-type ATP synthase delta subunit
MIAKVTQFKFEIDDAIVERCARALFKVAPFKTNIKEWEYQNSEYRNLCRMYAKAVLLEATRREHA